MMWRRGEPRRRSAAAARALRMAVRPGPDGAPGVALQRTAPAANAELGAENVRLQARATARSRIALMIALRSRTCSCARRQPRSRPSSSNYGTRVATLGGGAGGGLKARRRRTCRWTARRPPRGWRPRKSSRLSWRRSKAAGGSGGGGSTRGSTVRGAMRARGGTSRGGGHGGHGGGHCGGVVRGDDGRWRSAGGGSRRGRDVAAFAASPPPAPCRGKKRGSVRFALAEDAPPPLAAPIAASEEVRRRRYHRRRGPPLERPVALVSSRRQSALVPWRLQIASPLRLVRTRPTPAPEAGPPGGSHPRVPSDVSTGAPSTAGAHQVSIALPAEGAASGAPWRVTIDPTPTSRPPRPNRPLRCPRRRWRPRTTGASQSPSSASGDDGPRAASRRAGRRVGTCGQSEVAPWRVSPNRPRRWVGTVSTGPPGGAAEAVVRAPVQEAVVHMMQDGDGHASVQIVAAVAADELVSARCAASHADRRAERRGGRGAAGRGAGGGAEWLSAADVAAALDERNPVNSL